MLNWNVEQHRSNSSSPSNNYYCINKWIPFNRTCVFETLLNTRVTSVFLQGSIDISVQSKTLSERVQIPEKYTKVRYQSICASLLPNSEFQYLGWPSWLNASVHPGWRTRKELEHTPFRLLFFMRSGRGLNPRAASGKKTNQKIQKLNNQKNASLHHHFLCDAAAAAAAALFALSSRKLSLDAMSHSFYILGNTSCPNSVVCACPLTLVFRCVLSLLRRPAHCPFHSAQLCSTCVVAEDYFRAVFPVTH